jgi:hypothetical protein
MIWPLSAVYLGRLMGSSAGQGELPDLLEHARGASFYEHERKAGF